jgi:hypothetical protein
VYPRDTVHKSDKLFIKSVLSHSTRTLNLKRCQQHPRTRTITRTETDRMAVVSNTRHSWHVTKIFPVETAIY